MALQDLRLTQRGAIEEPAGGCACCAGTGPATERSDEVVDAPGTTEQVAVLGMTCGHCVSAVTEELKALPGVTGVEVTLVAGGTSSVSVTSTAPLPRDAVAAAVDEAGYQLADA